MNLGSLPEGVGDVSVMVPLSDGWPPPWAWKIVEGVVSMYGVLSVGGLKRG